MEAYEKGANAIELDIYLTTDGKLAIVGVLKDLIEEYDIYDQCYVITFGSGCTVTQALLPTIVILSVLCIKKFILIWEIPKRLCPKR